MTTTNGSLLSLDKASFINALKDIYEHSEWVAEGLFEQRNALASSSLPLHDAVRDAMRALVDQANHERKLALLCAHPDLAGKAALEGELTHASTNEQAGAGLDQCTPEELATFTELNDTYRSKFGFPFIMAVKGATKEQILAGFKERVPNDRDTEFDQALNEVHKIAGFRLGDFPTEFWQD